MKKPTTWEYISGIIGLIVIFYALWYFISPKYGEYRPVSDAEQRLYDQMDKDGVEETQTDCDSSPAIGCR